MANMIHALNSTTSSAIFRDNAKLRNAKSQPMLPLILAHPVSTTGKSILEIHSRLGNLLKELAQLADIPVESVLAVWAVESGPSAFVDNRLLLRLEVHKLWYHWGAANPDIFNRHFQFGGNAGIVGSSWTNHKFSDCALGQWLHFHGDQQKEYQAFELAVKLAGSEAACLSSSFGGPQILGSNHAKLGYDSARELQAAFAQSERWHVSGFFDFCQSHNLLDFLRCGDWHQFAAIYNGPGQADYYAAKINEAYQSSLALLNGLPEELEIFDHQKFEAFIASLGIMNFKFHEFLFKGRLHSTISHEAYGLNTPPPEQFWPNIAGVARLLDTVRKMIGAPIVLSSIFRSEAYNKAIGGSPQSRHLQFSAVDFKVKNGASPKQWAGQLRKWRDEGLFTGAVGTHEETVHLELRSDNVDF